MLDPFGGSGTVGVVALRHGRRAILIELKPEYVDMSRRRVAGRLFAQEAVDAGHDLDRVDGQVE